MRIGMLTDLIVGSSSCIAQSAAERKPVEVLDLDMYLKTIRVNRNVYNGAYLQIFTRAFWNLAFGALKQTVHWGDVVGHELRGWSPVAGRRMLHQVAVHLWWKWLTIVFFVLKFSHLDGVRTLSYLYNMPCGWELGRLRAVHRPTRWYGTKIRDWINWYVKNKTVSAKYLAHNCQNKQSCKQNIWHLRAKNTLNAKLAFLARCVPNKSESFAHLPSILFPHYWLEVINEQRRVIGFQNWNGWIRCSGDWGLNEKSKPGQCGYGPGARQIASAKEELGRRSASRQAVRKQMAL